MKEFRDLEILNWEPTSRGLVTARFDIKFPGGLTVRKFSISQDGERRWINIPAWTQLDLTTGKKIYNRVICFDDDQTLLRFKSAALAALDLQVGGDR